MKEFKSYEEIDRYNKGIFSSFMKDIFSDPSDPEKNHAKADKLMIEALEAEGYDCTLFKESEIWCA